MKKLLLLIAAGVGYVLGTKAGRERYDQMMGQFNKVKEDPRVQEKAHHAADLAKQQIPIVKEKVTHAADSASAKVKSHGSNATSEPGEKLTPSSTGEQDSASPQATVP